MNQLMNKIIPAILAFSACCFPLISFSHAFATNDLIKDFSPHDNKRQLSGTLGFFNSPSDIVLNSEGTRALITSTKSDTNEGAVVECTVNGDEGLSSCRHSLKSWEPSELSYGLTGLAFNPANTFVFATSNYQKTTDTVWRCRLDATGALVLTDCQPAIMNSVHYFNGNDGILVNSTGNFAYIVNHNPYPPINNLTNFKVSRCKVNTVTGGFSDCTGLGILGLNFPSGIAINSSGTFAFITNSGNSDEKFNNPNTVFRCSIDATTGALRNCDNTGGRGFSSPSRIALNRQGTRAFVANPGSNDIVRCIINKTGDFSDCKATGSGFHNPSAIVLNKENTAAFITNFSDGTVSRCLVDEDGIFSDCRSALYHVSVTDSTQHSLSFLNLQDLKDAPVITIENTGVPLEHFHLDAVSLQHAALEKSCDSELFNSGGKCRLYLKQDPSSVGSNVGFTVKLFNGDDLLYELPVGISGITAEANGWPIMFLNTSRGTAGSLNLKTSTEIEQMSLHFSNPELKHFFQGECLKTSSLRAGTSCALTYFVADVSKNISGLITVNQGSEVIYHLPVTIYNHAILEATNTILTRYNTTKVMLHNLSDRPLVYLQAQSPNPGLKLVNDGCNQRIEADKSCILTYFADVGPSVTESVLRVQAVGIMPFNIPLQINKVPEATVTVNNKGGYVLRTYYPKLNADGSIGVGKTGDILKKHNKTIKVATFNDPDNVRDSVAKEKNIKLDIVGSSINRHLPACNGGNIQCTRATVNAHCYYTDYTIKDGNECVKLKASFSSPIKTGK